MRVCKVCEKTLPISEFRKTKGQTGKFYYRKTCLNCEREAAKKYHHKNKTKQNLNSKKWREKNPEYKKKYNKENSEKLKEYRRKYESQTHIRIRKTVTDSIRKSILKNHSKKEGSCFNFLPFSIKELMTHLESKFESWMSWDNWGCYDPNTWDDNDPSTWTWQIDHIVPHSLFKYESMSDEEFIKCWDLSNLRPLSSKKNIIDGCKRTRHNSI